MKAKSNVRPIAQACRFMLCGILVVASAASANAAAIFNSETASGERALIVSRYNDVAAAAAKNNFRIAYLGSGQLKYQIDSVAPNWIHDVDLNGSRQIVIVESKDQGEDVIAQLLAKGNIVVSLGDAQSGVNSAFAKLEEIANQVGPVTPDVDDHGGKFRARISVVEENPYSERVIDQSGVSVSAYHHSPNGSRSFDSNEPVLLAAIVDAIQWAIADDRNDPQFMEKSGSWSLKFTRSGDCKAMNGTATAGTLNIRTKYFQRSNDGDSRYDYWYVRFVAEMVPGTFRNADVETWSDASSGGGYIFDLRDYDPTTSSGEVSLSADTFSAGWSYSVGDITVFNNSNLGLDDVRWYHDINQFAPVGWNTVKVEPGAMIRVPNGVYLPGRLDENHYARFIRISTWTTKGCGLYY